MTKLCLLKEFVYFNRYKQIDANSLLKMKTNNGNIKLLPSSANYDWVTSLDIADKYACEGKVIAMGRARYANIKYYEGKFISSNNNLIESKDIEILDSKYLYYYLKHNSKKLYVEGTSYPKFDKKSFDSLKISIPSMQSQKKTVEIIEKTEILIEKLNDKINDLNELIKSRFIFMN